VTTIPTVLLPRLLKWYVYATGRREILQILDRVQGQAVLEIQHISLVVFREAPRRLKATWIGVNVVCDPNLQEYSMLAVLYDSQSKIALITT
jgi:hypothetical protein